MRVNRLTILLLLVILCTVVSLASPLAVQVQNAVLPMLIGATCAALAYNFYTRERLEFIWAIIFMFCGVSLAIPELTFYWPTLVFVIPAWPVFLGLMITLIVSTTKVTYLLASLTALLGIFAWLLHHLMKTMEEYKEKQLMTSDTAREMEITLKRHNQELLDKQDNDLQIATLNERQRIAREMHDHAGHLLSRALLQIGALKAISDKPEQLEPIKETVGQAMDSLRTSVHNLFDTSIDLSLQLNQLAKDFNFCSINLNLNFVSEPSSKVKLALIAIFKESLANIMRHSNASRVDVVFMEHLDFYQWIITDNGTTALGQDFSLSSIASHGMGLGNIARRIESLGGHLMIKTTGGFTLFMTIPKELS